MSWIRHKAAASAAAVTTVAALALSACTVPVPGTDAAQESKVDAPPVTIDYSFAADATDVAPSAAKITVSDGEISQVALVPTDPGAAAVPAANADGTAPTSSNAESGAASGTAESTATDAAELPENAVPGTVSEDGTEWVPDAPLVYGQHYTVEVTAKNADGKEQRDSRNFTVVQPAEFTTPTLMSSGGNTIESNREYGVGLVLSVRFDSPPKDRRKVEEYMKVTTEPELEGNWYWISPTQADWRPKEFYPTGTKVSVDINAAGHEVADGQFVAGERQQADFTIGNKRVAVVDDNDKILRLYENDELIQEMPTSLGKGGYATHNGISMHFYTQPGTYTVLDKSSHIIMDSTTYGLPLEAGGYKTPINNAVRISNDGIYLHELNNIWAQGVQNVSHGCLNLSPVNAQFYFDWAVAGDVVEVLNTGGPELEPWQNGSWSVPWEEWQTGEADM